MGGIAKVEGASWWSPTHGKAALGGFISANNKCLRWPANESEFGSAEDDAQLDWITEATTCARLYTMLAG